MNPSYKTPRLLALAVIPVVVAFVFYAFFDRGSTYPIRMPISGAYIGILLAALVNVLLIFYRILRAQSVSAFYIVVVFIWVVVACLGVLFQSGTVQFNWVVKFNAEVASCLIVVLFGFLIASYKIVTPKALLLCIVFAALLFLFFSFSVSVQSFRGNRVDFAESRNYVSASFGVALASALLLSWGALSARGIFSRALRLSCFASSFIFALALMMSGAKSALVGVALVGILWGALFASARQVVVASVACCMVGVLSHWYLSESGLAVLANRLSLDLIGKSIVERWTLWAEAVYADSVFSLIFGRPQLYEVFNLTAVQPHNLFISWIRYGGAIYFISFGLLFGYAAIQSMRVLYVRRDAGFYAIFALFVILLVYVMVSGSMTRVLSFYFVLGYLAGEARNQVNYIKSEIQ